MNHVCSSTKPWREKEYSLFICGFHFVAGAYDPEWSFYLKKSKASQYCSSDWRDGYAHWIVPCHGISKGMCLEKKDHLYLLCLTIRRVSNLVMNLEEQNRYAICEQWVRRSDPDQEKMNLWVEIYFKILALSGSWLNGRKKCLNAQNICVWKSPPILPNFMLHIEIPWGCINWCSYYLVIRSSVFWKFGVIVVTLSCWLQTSTLSHFL